MGHRLQIPQRQADLHLRQPAPGVGGVYDAFTEWLAETAGAMKVADGFEPGAVIGPLIDMKAVEKVEAHIADAVKKAPRWWPAANARPWAVPSSSRRC
jgi:hypothetical protein